jgi:predicted transcriptional regulator
MESDVISEKQRELIDRFIEAYNGIQKRLARALREDPGEQLHRLIDTYGDRNRPWDASDGRWLRDIAPLRNVLVHDRLPGRPHLAVPLASVVEHIEAILERLDHPRMAIPTFQREVLTLDDSTTIADALRHVREKDYSQFPVYAEDRFSGLLTENGLTRWLARISAHHATSIVDLEEQPVRVVLALEEARESWAFASRDARADEVASLFADKPQLEAVLITHSGREHEKLLGIATRWDALMVLVGPQAQ